jgi:hypothetical protein
LAKIGEWIIAFVNGLCTGNTNFLSHHMKC